METGKIKFMSLGKICFWLCISFVIIFVAIYPVDFHNLGGTHSWLSGTTLKFVNNWLADGAWEDHFTCYESFDSIEFQTQEERVPYLSYPTGSTFVVYLVAKVLGKDHIGIYFLKHFQLLWYLAEALLLGAFLYILFTDLQIYSEREKNQVVYFTTLFWILQPVNIWYLANVYFADQAVILYVMAFLVLEYAGSRKITSRWDKIIRILNAVVIYFGILTDYYFWVLLFVAFMIRFARNLILKMGLKQVWKDILWYICPSVLALGTFIWQLSHTDNWLRILISRFKIRTVGELWKNTFLMCFENFYQTLADGSAARGILLVAAELFMILFVIWHFKKNGRWKSIFIKKEYAVVAAGVISPVLQILILRNHSAAHEFSMIKAGWILDMSIVILALVLQKLTKRSELYFCGKKVNSYVWNYIVSLILFLFLTGVPFSSSNFLQSRYQQVSYPLEKILYETAQYEEVYFSFTYEIPINPPQQLATSEKRVYRIDTVDEMNSMFPKLPDAAKRMLIIEKNKDGKDAGILEAEEKLAAKSELAYEDNDYCILRVIGMGGGTDK